MDKVYVVSAFGGEYEDKWERIIGVCPTKGLAEALKKRTEHNHGPESCEISKEEWREMGDAAWDYEEQNDCDFADHVDCLAKLFPQYSREQLEAADRIYCWEDDYCGVLIDEVNLFTSINEIDGNLD